jgi:hypothetical protein
MTHLFSWLTARLRSSSSEEDRNELLLAYNVTKNRLLASRVAYAGNGAGLLPALTKRGPLDRNEGIYTAPSQWVHRIGTRVPIDVAFVDSNGQVVHVHHALKPNRLSRLVWDAKGALELCAGRLRDTGTDVGDLIEIR